MTPLFEVSTRSTDWFKREFVEAVVNAGYKERIPNFLWSSQKVLTLFSDLRHGLSKWNLQSIYRLPVLVPSNGYLLLRESLPYNLHTKSFLSCGIVGQEVGRY